MKVKIKKEYYKKDSDCNLGFYLYRKNDIKNIFIKEIDFCCGEMKIAYEDCYIHFGEYDNSTLNINDNINIYKCYPYPEGTCWNEFAINFCPFCGKAIEIKEV